MPSPRGRLPFRGSSAVEQSTVNRLVAGSNPARGAFRKSHVLHGFFYLETDANITHYYHYRISVVLSMTVKGGTRCPISTANAVIGYGSLFGVVVGPVRRMTIMISAPSAMYRFAILCAARKDFCPIVARGRPQGRPFP